jgi:hypothetical protein
LRFPRLFKSRRSTTPTPAPQIQSPQYNWNPREHQSPVASTECGKITPSILAQVAGSTNDWRGSAEAMAAKPLILDDDLHRARSFRLA